MSTIPDYLPTLHRGNHPPNSGQACVMEYVSVLAGEEWTDSPTCTDPLIAAVARELNDLYEGDRQALLSFVNRLLQARFPDTGRGKHLADQFYGWAAYLCRQHGTARSIEQIADRLTNPAYCAPTEAINNLTRLLDQQDAMLGRGPAGEIGIERLAKATTVVQLRRGQMIIKMDAYASLLVSSAEKTPGVLGDTFTMPEPLAVSDIKFVTK